MIFMKNIQSKFILFCALLTALAFSSFLYYLQNELENYFKHKTLDDFQILAEQSKTSYFAFTEALKIRAVDWSSDGFIRKMTEKILKLPEQSDVKELNAYLRDRKMPFDRSVIIVDILDKNGTVVASSRDDRLGVDEKAEEEKLKAHRFSETIHAGFGEVFITNIVREEDESPEPMIHLTVRIFSEELAAGKLKPLDAVLLVHFTNTGRLGDILSGRWQLQKGAKTGQALYNRLKTAEIYAVNSERLAITPLRFVPDAVLKRAINTEPVRACFERGQETTAEYLNYAGEKVLGASMCVLRDNTVLILEAKTEEILSPLKKIRFQFVLIGMAFFILIVAGIIILSNWFAKGIEKSRLPEN